MDKFLLSIMMLMMFLMPANAASITTSEWTKVASSSDFDPIARYILVSGTRICSYIPNATTGSTYLKPCTDTVTDKSGVISSIPEDAAIFTFPTFNATDKSTLVLLSSYAGVQAGYYYTAEAKKMQLKTAESEGTKATVNINTKGNAEITFSSYGTIYRNNNDSRFLNYTSTTQSAVTLYKEKAAGPSKPTISFDDITKQVSITAEEGAAVYYTTDNSEPTENSTPYNGAFNISKTTTVKAIAVKDGNKSETATLLCPVPENAFVEVDSSMTDWVRVGESVEVKFTASPAVAAQYVVITTGNPDIRIEKNAEGKWMLTGVAVNEYIEYSLKFADGCGYVDINDTPISGVVEVVPGRPVADPAPCEDGFINIKEGDSVTFSCAGAEKIFVLQDEDVAPSYDNHHTVTFPTIGDYLVTVFPVKGENKTYEDKYGLIEGFKIKVAEKPAVTTTTFELVKTTNDIAAGREYVIYGATKTNQGVMSKTLTSPYFSGLSDYTLNGEVITLSSEDVALITLEEAADGQFYLKNQDGKYINSTKDGSTLSDNKASATSYTIRFRTGSSENAIEIKSGPGPVFTYNGNQTSRFRGYGNHQAPTFLYVKPKPTPSLSFKEPELTVYLSALVNGEEPVAHELVNTNNLPLERITFSSDKPEVVDIDDLSYEMIFKGKGKATITATYPGDDTYKEATASYALNVELTKPMEQNEGVLEPPVPFDESGNWMKATDFTNTGTDFIRFEHESGVEIYYSAVANNAESQPQAAPARAAAANQITVDGETYAPLATEEGENKVSGTFSPYAADSGVDFTNGGTLKVLAKKGEVYSQPHTFTFTAVPTGVEGIEADGAEYYTLQGVRVANPDKGIYIRVLNGKAVKVAL